MYGTFAEYKGCAEPLDPYRLGRIPGTDRDDPGSPFRTASVGWLKPTRTAEAALLFRQDDVYRIRKLERLCSDFELHTLGGSIVMDLLDRIATLELRIRELTDR